MNSAYSVNLYRQWTHGKTNRVLVHKFLWCLQNAFAKWKNQLHLVVNMQLKIYILDDEFFLDKPLILQKRLSRRCPTALIFPQSEGQQQVHCTVCDTNASQNALNRQSRVPEVTGKVTVVSKCWHVQYNVHILYSCSFSWEQLFSCQSTSKRFIIYFLELTEAWPWAIRALRQLC